MPSEMELPPLDNRFNLETSSVSGSRTSQAARYDKARIRCRERQLLESLALIADLRHALQQRVEEAQARQIGGSGLYVPKAQNDAWKTRAEAAESKLASHAKEMRELENLRREMRWMHVSCEPDNCHTSGEGCTGGAPVDLSEPTK